MLADVWCRPLAICGGVGLTVSTRRPTRRSSGPAFDRALACDAWSRRPTLRLRLHRPMGASSPCHSGDLGAGVAKLFSVSRPCGRLPASSPAFAVAWRSLSPLNVRAGAEDESVTGKSTLEQQRCSISFQGRSCSAEELAWWRTHLLRKAAAVGLSPSSFRLVPAPSRIEMYVSRQAGPLAKAVLPVVAAGC